MGVGRFATGDGATGDGELRILGTLVSDESARDCHLVDIFSQKRQSFIHSVSQSQITGFIKLIYDDY